MLKRVFMLIGAAIIVATAIGAKKAHANPVCDALRFYDYEVMKGRQLGLSKYVTINGAYANERVREELEPETGGAI